jgi:polysaccharide deacetylase family protein (PEP-CTERM system associated)
MHHAFTVDVEEWFHGIPINEQVGRAAKYRLHVGLDVLLQLMTEYQVRGTFFVLGPVARDSPQLIQRIANSGHELGCHGWSHELLYRITPQRMYEETLRATEIIADVTGKRVTSYRAPLFSITKQSLWSLEVLAKLGYLYDSSIFPVRNWRYGIADFERRPHLIQTLEGPIFEFPLSTRRVLGCNMPVSGGAYFRIYPYWLTSANFRTFERENRPVIFYLHPWELDIDQPRVRFYWKARLTHYFNLGSTVGKLRRLLGDFKFVPLGEMLDDHIAVSKSKLQASTKWS